MISVKKLDFSEFQITKKQKYVGLAVTFFLVSYLSTFVDVSYLGIYLVLAILFFVMGTLFVQRPNNIWAAAYMSLLPSLLVISTISSLFYFPYLSLVVKLGAIGLAASLYYAVLVVENIVNVSMEYEKGIPLYRAAQTWIQVLIVVVSIPLFSSYFKVDVSPLIQSALLSLTTFFLSMHTLWVLKFDPDVRVSSIKTSILDSLMLSFAIFAVSSGVSFFPTEPFLKAIFLASVLMGLLGYLIAHYKNLVTNRLVTEYIFVSSVFLGILLLLQP